MFSDDEDVKKIIAGDRVLAGHKIQVTFGPGRTDRREFKALLTLWESGKYFNGEGDGQIYACLDHRLFEHSNTTPPSALPIYRKMEKEKRTEFGCGGPIVSADIHGPVAMCQSCQNMVKIEDMTGQIPFFGSVGELAELVTIIFHRLRDDADIYCKYDRSDIRYETQVRQRGAEEAHRLRALFIYPLYRILQDVGSGASIENRFKAFFRA